MIAVSNTTPLRYLIAIGQDDLLGRLFEKVFVPTGVHEELTDPRTPEVVRRNILSRPAWLEIRAVRETHTTEFPATLHRGEREAILLAETLRADVLLVDEQIGRTIALSRNIPQLLKQLKASGFFIANSLEQQLLQRNAARRR